MSWNNQIIPETIHACMSNFIHVTLVSGEKEDFECDGIGDTGGKIEQRQCLSQEARRKKLLHICLYFFQIIKIMF